MTMKNLKIIVLGDRGVGKSSLIQKYINDSFGKTPGQLPSLDLEDVEDISATNFIEKRVVVDDEEVSVRFWDPPSVVAPLPHSFYAGAHGCCMVFSTVDAESLQQLQYWYESLAKYCSESNCPLPPIVISENKVDLIDQSVVDAEAVEQAAKQYKLRLYRTSAKRSHQVKELFDYITGKASKYQFEQAGANGTQKGKPARTLSAASWTLAPDDQANKETTAPSKRRTGGVKPLFNKNKCPVM